MTTFKHKYNNKELSVKDFVEVELDGNDYERGQVETAYAQANNTTECLARLISFLHDKGLMSKRDIQQVVTNYIPRDFEE